MTTEVEMLDMPCRINGSEQVLVAPDGPYTLRLKGAMSMSEQSTFAHEDSQVLARFWAKVNKAGSDECWLWTASTRNKGYGAFAYTWGGKMVHDRAHRFSYRLHVGPIPDGLYVLHRCDNPACVNPAHLWLGTKADNNADMCAKGRHVRGGTHCGEGKYRRGENHHSSKINEDIAKSIRNDKASGMSYSALSRKYGLAIGYLHRVVHRKAWKHVK